MKSRLAAIFASASLLLSGCAVTGPALNISQNSQCLTEIKDENKQVAIQFDEACGRKEIEKARLQEIAIITENRRTVEMARQLTALQLIVSRAAIEIGSPEQEDTFSRRLLMALEHTDRNIRAMAEKERDKAGIKDEDIKTKIAHWNELRKIRSNVCTRDTITNALVCGAAVKPEPSPAQ